MHHMRTFVTDRFGRAGWERVIEKLPKSEIEEMRALLPMTWHDLDLQHRVLRLIDAEYGDGVGGLVPQIARFEADQDLRLLQRIFLRVANPAYVLEKAGEYWDRFYDSGAWEVVRESPNRARATLSGVMPFDDYFGTYVTEYCHRLFELVGAKSVSSSHRLTGPSDSPTIALRLEWA